MSTQQLDSMATELDRRCPICLDSMDDASYTMPCLHQFCFGCIRRWAESRPTCPLCKRRVESILCAPAPAALAAPGAGAALWG
uniref:RING-type E3 ubiquitin transferase n=1 Tax=Phasianus colchicus TaxID=9054 RepID=A0A669QTL8_PHACC